MPLEWYPSGKAKPSIFTLSQEIVDQILENLYLHIVESSLTYGYAQKKLYDWQFRLATKAFGVEEGPRWATPWVEFESVLSMCMEKAKIMSAFSLLPQEIIDEIAQYHYLALLDGSLYTGGAYTKIMEWQMAVPAQAFGVATGRMWMKDLSYYPKLAAAFNARARGDNVEYH